jgi:hypothetical protein
VAEADRYGLVEIPEQEHELWLDTNSEYSIARFHEELATKIFWGPSQTISAWVLDQDTGSEWKIRRDEHFQQMIKDRWDQRCAVISVDVVRKDASSGHVSYAASRGGCVSSVTSGPNEGGGSSAMHDDAEGFGDTCSSPAPAPTQMPVAVDWSSLIIVGNADDDGLAKEVADEDMVYEAMGFKEAEAPASRQEVPIPAMSAQMQADMNEAAVNVDDRVDEEPMQDWDRENPDMSVGIIYPSMDEFRLAMR